MNAALPSVLYRFRPWSVFSRRGVTRRVNEMKRLKEIEENYAFFSSPFKFNDPQDSGLGPEYTGDTLADIERLGRLGLFEATRLVEKQKCDGIAELDSNEFEVKQASLLQARRAARQKTRLLCL